MRTPYTGHANIGDADIELSIENVDTINWIGYVLVAGSIDSLDLAAVTVTLMEQPRPGWAAPAVIEQATDGSRRIIGTGRFRNAYNARASRAVFRMRPPDGSSR
jgi:hypothetical protein